METISAPYHADGPVSASKQFKNHTRNNPRGPVSRKGPRNWAPAMAAAAPPPHPPSVFSSFSSLPSSLFIPSGNNPHQQLQPQSQPPLLPLPPVHCSLPLQRAHSSIPALTRGIFCPPRTSGRTRDKTLAPKKAKQAVVNKREDSKQKDFKLTRAQSVSSPVGPDTNHLPKDMPKVMMSPSPYMKTNSEETGLEGLSSSVFMLSPPPSSLPKPKFSLRPKLSCNAEAAGADAGATDDLRRMLRLQ